MDLDSLCDISSEDTETKLNSYVTGNENLGRLFGISQSRGFSTTALWIRDVSTPCISESG